MSHCGYYYTMISENPSKTIWKCDKQVGCPARAHTVGQFEASIICLNDHCHPPVYEIESKLALLCEVKTQARVQSIKPRQIITNCIAQVDKDDATFKYNPQQ